MSIVALCGGVLYIPGFWNPISVKEKLNVEGLRRKDTADDDNGVPASSELVHRKPRESILPGGHGLYTISRTVHRCARHVSQRAGVRGAGHRYRWRLPFQSGYRRTKLDQL